MDLCRRVIRQQVGRSNIDQGKLDNLNLPKAIRDYLEYKDRRWKSCKILSPTISTELVLGSKVIKKVIWHRGQVLFWLGFFGLLNCWIFLQNTLSSDTRENTLDTCPASTMFAHHVVDQNSYNWRTSWRSLWSLKYGYFPCHVASYLTFLSPSSQVLFHQRLLPTL